MKKLRSLLTSLCGYINEVDSISISFFCFVGSFVLLVVAIIFGNL